MESFKEEYKQRLRHVHGFDFKEMALALFRFQFEYNLTYQAYVNARGIDVTKVQELIEIYQPIN